MQFPSRSVDHAQRFSGPVCSVCYHDTTVDWVENSTNLPSSEASNSQLRAQRSNYRCTSTQNNCSPASCSIFCQPALLIGASRMTKAVHIISTSSSETEAAPSSVHGVEQAVINPLHYYVDSNCGAGGVRFYDGALQRFVQMKESLNVLCACVPFRVRSTREHTLIGRVVAFDAVCRGTHYNLKVFFEYPINIVPQVLFQDAASDTEIQQTSVISESLQECTTSECYDDFEYERQYQDGDWIQLSELLSKEVCSFNEPVRKELIPSTHVDSASSSFNQPATPSSMAHPGAPTVSHWSRSESGDAVNGHVTIATLHHVWRLDDRSDMYNTDREYSGQLFMTPIQEIYPDSSYELVIK